MFPLQTKPFFSTDILHFTISSLTEVNIISWDSKFRYTRMDIDFHLIGNNNEHSIKKINYTKKCYWRNGFFLLCSVFVIRNYTITYTLNVQKEALKYLNEDNIYINNGNG